MGEERLSTTGRLHVERRVAALYGSLVEGGERERERAAQALTLLGAPAVPTLLTFLQKGDATLCPIILDVLAEVGDARAVAPIIRILVEGPQRAEAARVLGILGDGYAVPALIDALAEADHLVRLQAIEALGKIGDARAVAPLLTLLGGAKAPSDASVAWALGCIGDERAVEPLLEALHDRRRWGWESPGAASALRTIGGPRVVGLLLELLADSDPLWREIGAYGVGRPHEERAIAPLLVALADREGTVRDAAAESLGMIGDERVVGPLVAAGTGTAWATPRPITHALARLGEKGMMALADLLASPRAELRAEAVHALGASAAPHSVRLVVQALTDDDTRVRFHAARALGVLGDGGASDPLLATLVDPDAGVRGEAAAALAALGDRRALDPLLALLFDAERGRDIVDRIGDAVARLGDEQTFQRLLTTLAHGSPDERRTAAMTIDTFDDPRALKPLIAALEDTDPGVREMASYALSRLGDPHVIAPLVGLLLRDRNETTAWILGTFGDRALPTLLPLFHGDDAGVRDLAMIALGRIGSDKALGPLLTILPHVDGHMFWAETCCTVKRPHLLRKRAPIRVQGVVAHYTHVDGQIKLTIMRELTRGKEPLYGMPVSAHAVEPLIALLNDERDDVRRAAAGALGETNDQRAVAPLITLLAGNEAEMRALAADGLDQLRDKRAVLPLIRALGDPDATVRMRAATALGHLGDRHALEPLIGALVDDHPQVRQAAAFGLFRLGDPGALPALRRMRRIDDGRTSWGSNAEAAARAITYLETGDWPAGRSNHQE